MRSAYLAVAVPVLLLTSCTRHGELDRSVQQARDTPPVSAFLLRTVRPVSITSTLDGNDPVGRHWLVTGQFEYVIPKPGEAGIVSDGFGGACLFTEQDQSCTSDDDCTAPPGGAASCLNKSHTGPVGALQPGPAIPPGICWARPADKFACLKAGPDLHQPLALNTKYAAPFDQNSPTRLPVRNKPWHVLMVTCLNPPSDQWSAAGAPCGSGEPGALHRYGRMYSVPAG